MWIIKSESTRDQNVVPGHRGWVKPDSIEIKDRWYVVVWQGVQIVGWIEQGSFVTLKWI